MSESPTPVESENGPPAADAFGRPLERLRISVTDRCNLRCTYCMPKEVFGPDYPHLSRSETLSYEEIIRLARLFLQAGVRRIRLTGGEPLVRKHIEKLVEMLAGLPGLDDLAMTTNGVALTRQKARALRDAGLRRLTLSLDTLDDGVFRRITESDFSVQRVLEAIEHAEAVGFRPIKINMVVKRGLNEADILPMARRFRGTGHILRFIEYMDVGTSNRWRYEDVVSAAEIIATIDAEFPLEPLSPAQSDEVAQRWRYRDGAGEIGVIASVTRPFCSHCTRARLSADGRLYTCLFAARGHDLKTPLRAGAPDEALLAAIRAAWTGRTDRYSELRLLAHAPRAHRIEMSYIGG
jgi:cyclic pyranopterin phosphate synthase